MISKDEVIKVAKLARLSLNDHEVEKYTMQLDNIMMMISEMQQVNISGIIPMTTPLSTGSYVREDIVTEGNISEELFSNAPGKNSVFAKEINCFIVPKVIE